MINDDDVFIKNYYILEFIPQCFSDLKNLGFHIIDWKYDYDFYCFVKFEFRNFKLDSRYFENYDVEFRMVFGKDSVRLDYKEYNCNRYSFGYKSLSKIFCDYVFDFECLDKINEFVYFNTVRLFFIRLICEYFICRV